MIKWMNLREVTNECGFADTRTFLKHYIETYPPDRQTGDRKWWKKTTVDRIKEIEFSDEEVTDEEGA